MAENNYAFVPRPMPETIQVFNSSTHVPAARELLVRAWLTMVDYTKGNEDRRTALSAELRALLAKE